ncbi:MAG: hypothetical protein ACQESG_01590 [Nanobdellota archaeon]
MDYRGVVGAYTDSLTVMKGILENIDDDIYETPEALIAALEFMEDGCCKMGQEIKKSRSHQKDPFLQLIREKERSYHALKGYMTLYRHALENNQDTEHVHRDLKQGLEEMALTADLTEPRVQNLLESLARTDSRYQNLELAGDTPGDILLQELKKELSKVRHHADCFTDVPPLSKALRSYESAVSGYLHATIKGRVNGETAKVDQYRQDVKQMLSLIFR